MGIYKELLYPKFLSGTDPEWVHDQTVKLLRVTERYKPLDDFLKRVFSYENPRLEADILGMRVKNVLGLAAGYDKNAELVQGASLLGFGFTEVGTVTPLPQEGNARPRIFRLREDRALINRMGFPGAGGEKVVYNLRESRDVPIVVGVSIGPNKKSVDEGTALRDYEALLNKFDPLADYLAVNVSSPNTPGLRDLLFKDKLKDLLEFVSRWNKDRNSRIFLKISPDLTYEQLDNVLDLVLRYGISGIIAVNTTIARPDDLRSFYKTEKGGLSGPPLRKRANEIIRYIYERTEGKLPIIGVAGIEDANDAIEKIKAGASLVEAYTGLVYEGPFFARNIKTGIVKYLDREGVNSVKDLVGAGVHR